MRITRYLRCDMYSADQTAAQRWSGESIALCWCAWSDQAATSFISGDQLLHFIVLGGLDGHHTHPRYCTDAKSAYQVTIWYILFHLLTTGRHSGAAADPI